MTDHLRELGRFAPSPTGDLHLGSAAAALFAAAFARRAGGGFALRMEDIDRARVVAGKADEILDDLRWLGIAWEGETVLQSARTALYESALGRLAERGLTYFCDCSRAEIALAASAPHAGEEGPRYPGTCRSHGMRERPFRRPPAVRLAVPEGARVRVDDAVLGPIDEEVDLVTGDFVLRRGDGVFAYQLAVVVDDLGMGVTEVVRGRDLAASAPRQALLARLLGGEAPRFAHVPLVVGDDGGRLAKRAKGVTIRDHRARGGSGGELLRAIARAYDHPLASRGDPVAALAEALDVRRLAALDVVPSAWILGDGPGSASDESC